MPERRPHILLENTKNSVSYTPKSRRIELPPDQPFFDQREHGELLQRAYHRALEAAERQYQELGLDPQTADQGVAVEMRFRPGSKIDITKLENAQGRENIELLNVRVDESGTPISAVLYVPHRRKSFIEKQIDDYREPERNTRGGMPKNYKKYDKTEDISIATLASFWLDQTPLPEDTHFVGAWEVWLREGQFEVFKERASELDNASISAHTIRFPEREICALHCSIADLLRLELLTKAVTGFRYLRTGGDFFDSMPPTDQAEWLADLLERLVIPDDLQVSVCLLDTGLFASHPLLEPVVAENAVDSYDPPNWGIDDHHGHGTEMAGIACFGDLARCLEGTERVTASHLIESVKVFPPTGQNDDEHIAYITAQAVDRAEVNRRDMRRIFCLSWAVGHDEQKDGVTVTHGRPTPLSARIDQLAFGVDEADDWAVHQDTSRLLSVAVGNIADAYPPPQYPDINDLSEAEDPSQAWNALSVGALTEKVFTHDPTYDGWQAVAGLDELSPKSRTSVLWGDSYWPIKPDIVLEGGNYLTDGHYMEPHPDTCPLSTGKEHIFCSVQDSSAANAEASRLAAQIASEYPEFWPESVRGLLVHAAGWSEGMLSGRPIENRTKDQKIALLRRYGYGKPNLDRLTRCYSNQPCVVIQDSLKPFAPSENGSNIVSGDMNYYQLPWPKEALEQIYDQEVNLKVTLSYFIEPNPSERPPTTKYSYASHELRFRLKELLHKSSIRSHLQ